MHLCYIALLLLLLLLLLPRYMGCAMYHVQVAGAAPAIQHLALPLDPTSYPMRLSTSGPRYRLRSANPVLL